MYIYILGNPDDEKNRNNDLKNKHNKLKREYNQLTADFTVIKDENTTLKTTVAQLQSDKQLLINVNNRMYQNMNQNMQLQKHY